MKLDRDISLTHLIVRLQSAMAAMADRVEKLEAKVARFRQPEPPQEAPDTSMRGICRQVAKAHEMSQERLRGRDRFKEAVLARREFCVKAHQAGFSTTQIGRFLGGRDHTTIMEYIAPRPRKNEASPGDEPGACKARGERAR